MIVFCKWRKLSVAEEETPANISSEYFHILKMGSLNFAALWIASVGHNQFQAHVEFAATDICYKSYKL